MSIFDAISSVATGGIAGLLGTGITAGIDIFKQKQDNKQQLAMQQFQINLMRMEGEQKVQVAQTEGETAKEVAAADKAARTAISADGLLAASYKHSMATVGTPWVQNLRGSVRPILTYYMVLVMTVITIWSAVQSGSETAWGEYFKTLMDSVIFLATTMVTWWFGTRQKK